MGALAAVVAGSPGVAHAAPGEGPMCRPDAPRASVERLLRRASLDLLGRVPTVDEYAALEGRDALPEALVDRMLGAPAFAERVVRAHGPLLWPNIENVRLMDFRTRLQRAGDIYWRRGTAQTYRGDRVPCRDAPATFGPGGQIEVETDADGVRREGWVEVQPYWATDRTIKVCAFDAQTRDVSPRGRDCRAREGLFDPGCGCGPALRRCRVGSTRPLARAFRRDVEIRIAAMIQEGRPYTELFTSRRAFVNGPIVHYLKYQAGLSAGVGMRPLAYDLDRLPDLAWTDDGFVPVELPAEHAGVLTSFPFLLRFQTDRARANRFYEAFLCQPFSPPPGGLPEVPPGTIPNPDLQKRDGCKYCHALLEPAAAHWGRWTQQGTGYLDAEAFPAVRDDCVRCAQSGRRCSAECRLHYVTRALSPEETPFLGRLDAFRFLRAEHQAHVEMGPKLLVANAIVDDRFPRCVARRALEGMLGRPVRPAESDLVAAAGRRFVQSGYDYRALVKSIVTSAMYRRSR
jgi:NAD-dependent dihydropyrimidine dehydrogenase PreA subunit